MSTQEIIIYRNPLQPAVWNTIASGEALPFFIWAFVFFATLIFLNGRFKKQINKNPGSFMIGSLIFSIAATWLLFKFI